MSTVVFLNQEFAGNPLRRRIDRDGHEIPDEYEARGLRVRRVDGGWELAVPLRTMGESVYQEAAPADQGGNWTLIGTYPSQAAAQRIAAVVESGIKVWRAKYRDQNGTVPPQLVFRGLAEHEIKQGIAARATGL